MNKDDRNDKLKEQKRKKEEERISFTFPKGWDEEPGLEGSLKYQ